ncbi:MAG: bifunctional diaminohydroxyphosphoribosylaminopyrimidine deaminase/5-amino-6-(5-phosphoribosylamino)uracil reductase RibD [Arenicellales bacterium]
MVNTTDHSYMARALRLAELGRYSTQPNPRVGCVIVKNNQIIAEGFHQQAGKAHAEIHALNLAGEGVKDADIFITLEPCSHQGKTPPCVDALIQAQPKRVIIAMQDPNPLVSGKGINKLSAHGIETVVGIGEAEARRLNRGFIQRMEKARPFVTLKLATSLDGRIAMKSGESTWITSDAARTDVHRMRLMHGAVITGINTVLADNPQLTARLSDKDLPDYFRSNRQPVRVVLDSENRFPANAVMLETEGQTWQVTAQKTEGSVADRQVILPLAHGRIDLDTLLEYLAQQEINDVMVEAGGILAASFIKAGLVDELVVYQSPDIMGASAQPMINLPEILQMNEKIQFEYQEVRKIGRDLKLTLIPNR